jgi:hypothetical protein
MHVAEHLAVLHRAELGLGAALVRAGRAHPGDPDLAHLCARAARECDDHVRSLDAYARHADPAAAEEVEHTGPAPFGGPRTGGLGLLRDVLELYLMAADCEICWTVADQAAHATRDDGLAALVTRCHAETAGQVARLRERVRAAAARALAAP